MIDLLWRQPKRGVARLMLAARLKAVGAASVLGDRACRDPKAERHVDSSH